MARTITKIEVVQSTPRSYQPTVDLWDADNMERLINGDLVLCPGQWVKCGSERSSRFCGVRPSGVIVATHPQDNGDGRVVVDADRFRSNLQYAQG